MMGPQLEPCNSKEAPTGVDISAGPDREHSFAPQGRGDFEVVGAEVKRAAAASTPCVYLAALALRELLMNDEDGWTSQPEARRHTHARKSAGGPQPRDLLVLYVQSCGRGKRVGIFSSVWSVSTLAVDQASISRVQVP